jgi:hypothetical protein
MSSTQRQNLPCARLWAERARFASRSAERGRYPVRRARVDGERQVTDVTCFQLLDVEAGVSMLPALDDADRGEAR